MRWPAFPSEESSAAGRVELVLAGLAGLDEIEPAADLRALRQVLELELADTLPRVGRFGEGVLVAPLSAAIGLDLDVVYVVGLAEDLYPGRLHEDALLPDRVRRAARGRAARVPGPRSTASTGTCSPRSPRHRVVATFPRGDLRRQTTGCRAGGCCRPCAPGR